jgi:hypothetical protein
MTNQIKAADAIPRADSILNLGFAVGRTFGPIQSRQTQIDKTFVLAWRRLTLQRSSFWLVRRSR